MLAGAGGILLLQPLGTQAQSPIPDMAIVGVDNTVEYIEKLNFLSGTQKGGTSRYASTGTLEGTLVASGTVQVGTTNQVDKATSFVGGGSGNIVRAENAVIVGGQGNQI
ncbi:MAG: hypothetical protein LBP53_08170 [Candidatus Peribacteria bacterium]|nr:hypothetical protein [Candidatus Peribacteria bacterium]